jgi:hypothetical protein
MVLEGCLLEPAEPFGELKPESSTECGWLNIGLSSPLCSDSVFLQETLQWPSGTNRRYVQYACMTVQPFMSSE